MTTIAIDLGTTNVKVAAFDGKLQTLGAISNKVSYSRDGNRVEFDAIGYFDMVAGALRSCCSQYVGSPDSVRQLVFTGQAESLILLDSHGEPVRPGISWLDMRSERECEILQEEFPSSRTYAITGQPAIIPTWPITKILWLRSNEPESYSRVDKYLLLKDYILFRLTGTMAGEYSIYNFSHYFDIRNKRYYEEILERCGVSLSQLPPLVEPQTVVGSLTPESARLLGLAQNVKVNAGTLDHFAGMLGTGSTDPGVVSETTGTVLSVATMVRELPESDVSVPLHYGPFPDTYVYLPVCESGGVSLEWFKDGFLGDTGYNQLNAALEERSMDPELLFLPYLTGVNAPDFNADASGVFFGLRFEHDRIDLANAIMEGVAHLLKVNVDALDEAGVRTTSLVSTGGAARSDHWSQLKADITGFAIEIPENEEAGLLGAAMIGAVEEGLFGSFQDAVDQTVSIAKRFEPRDGEQFAQKHRLFRTVYEQLGPAFKLARTVE